MTDGPGALPSAGRLLEEGRVPNLDQLASVVHSTVHGGAAHGCRALDVRVAGGVDLRLLPDRGFDIGAAWYRGIPLGWISPVGESAPLETPSGSQWLSAFGGGLVVTCGLLNVGAPSEGHGLHGRYSHLRATDVAVERLVEDGDVVVAARARVDEAQALGPHLRVERIVRTRTGSGVVELVDVTANLGDRPEPAPILYHVNLGAPLWDPGARLELASEEVVPRDADAQRGLASWDRAGLPQPGAPEQVFEHVMTKDPSGWAAATVINRALGLGLTLEWRQETLPRLHQWIHPALAALALEPANCSVLGRAADRAAGRLPVLGPGERRTTELRIRVGPA